MNKYNFSFFVGGIKVTIPTDNNMTLTDLQKLVRSNQYHDKVIDIRNGNKSIKSTLDYITPAGTFHSRSNAQIIQRSGIFCIDFDHVSDTRVLKANLIKLFTPCLFFDSPSGDGIKVFYYIDTLAAEHIDYFRAFQNYFRLEMNLEIDKQCSDISRACYLSWDCNSYYNDSAPLIGAEFIKKYLPKPVEKTNIVLEPLFNTKTVAVTSEIEQCDIIRKNLDKSESFVSGNRNHYAGLLCAGLNRIGISQNTALNYLYTLEQTDFTKDEISKIVLCSYKQTDKHGCNPLKLDTNPVSMQTKSTNKPYSESSNNQPLLCCETLENMIEKAKNAPKLRFLWSGIMVGSFGFVFGPPKSGKTIFCENLALMIAAGKESFFNKRIEERMKVFFVSMEEYWQPRTERNQKQLQFINASLGDYFKIVDENFPRILSTKEDWDLLKKHIIESGSKLVFVDSLTRMYSGSIEDSNTAKEIGLKLRELTNELAITLIVIHHTPKVIGRPITIDSLAGSRILAQEADFLIGVSKSADGTRYVKEVAFRYKPEDDEKVTTFTINDNAFLEPTNHVSEASILKEKDGRADSTNTDMVLDLINEKSISPQGYATTKDLFVNLVDNDIMSKPTLYAQLKKLQSKGKITNPSKGIYKVNT
ncbi:BT4734/BF3469 family protein [Porphyromonadaceae sp. NP-X]|jgi:RecA-family ATPase|nr:BT4734/BF3469 family protein [Porphyromonadaceae sp. NP-X]